MAISRVEAWVKLSKADVTARRLRLLLEEYGSPEAILQEKPSYLLEKLKLPPSIVERISWARQVSVEQDLRRLEALKVQLITYEDPDYPLLLREIFDPPPLLFVRGTFSSTDSFAVAIVGSRRASSRARQIASHLAKELAQAGCTIVSGLAQGIDTAVHKGALEGGRTLAVMASGIDLIYPPQNRDLAEQIARQGVLLTEFAPGTQPDAWRFPARNRLISGLSKGVVLCEAPLDSGAMITARYAAEQNREVMAVPGWVDDGRSSGCHALIKDGAALIENAQDVLNAIGLSHLQPQERKELPIPEITPEERTILDLITFEQKLVEEIIEASGLPPYEVSSRLLTLELKGLIRKLPGGLYVRTMLI